MLRQVRQRGLESVWDAVGICFVDRGRSTMVVEPYLVLVWVRHDEDCRRVRVHEHVAFLLE